MKARNIGKPIAPTFSGTASKILGIVADADETLEKYTGLLVGSIYSGSFDSNDRRVDFKIYREKKEAKELTCKGGLMASELMASKEIEEIDIKSIKDVYVLGFGPSDSIKYGDVFTKNPGARVKIVEEVKQFLKFFLGLDNKESFREKSSDRSRSINPRQGK